MSWGGFRGVCLGCSDAQKHTQVFRGAVGWTPLEGGPYAEMLGAVSAPVTPVPAWSHVASIASWLEATQESRKSSQQCFVSPGGEHGVGWGRGVSHQPLGDLSRSPRSTHGSLVLRWLGATCCHPSRGLWLHEGVQDQARTPP